MMLPFFKVRPPLSTGQRVNLDLLMRRTIEAIGSDLPRKCEIVRDLCEMQIDTVSPITTLKSAESAILNRIPSIEAKVTVEVTQQSQSGLPSAYLPATDSAPARIAIDAATLDDPLRTTVELANQYSSHFWHCGGRMDLNQIHPNLTDLLPICCGLGILSSDASFYDVQWSEGGWQGWSMSRTGYYNASEIGYAAALLARHRGECNPRWLQSMRLDSRAAARKAFRYFEHCDQLNRPLLFDANRIPSTRCNPAELAAWLGGEDEAFALAAGYALSKIDSSSPLVVEAAIEVVRGDNADLVAIALELLGRFRPVTNEIRSLVDHLVGSHHEQVSIAAIQAAQSLGMPLTQYRHQIASHLAAYAEGCEELIEVVTKGGHQFESLDALVCQHLAESIHYRNQSATSRLVICLRQISNDPKQSIEREIKDAELKDRALRLVS